MARSLVTITEHYSFDFLITGYHVYREVWTPVIGEIMDCQRDKANKYDTHATKIVREQCTVGHVPRDISKWISYLLLSGCKISVQIMGGQQNRRNNVLEIPVMYIIKGPFYHVNVARIFIRDYLGRMKVQFK